MDKIRQITTGPDRTRTTTAADIVASDLYAQLDREGTHSRWSPTVPIREGKDMYPLNHLDSGFVIIDGLSVSLSQLGAQRYCKERNRRRCQTQPEPSI